MKMFRMKNNEFEIPAETGIDKALYSSSSDNSTRFVKCSPINEVGKSSNESESGECFLLCSAKSSSSISSGSIGCWLVNLKKKIKNLLLPQLELRTISRSKKKKYQQTRRPRWWKYFHPARISHWNPVFRPLCDLLRLYRRAHGINDWALLLSAQQ